jgi:hypothetical protein
VRIKEKPWDTKLHIIVIGGGITSLIPPVRQIIEVEKEVKEGDEERCYHSCDNLSSGKIFREHLSPFP